MGPPGRTAAVHTQYGILSMRIACHASDAQLLCKRVPKLLFHTMQRLAERVQRLPCLPTSLVQEEVQCTARS